MSEILTITNLNKMGKTEEKIVNALLDIVFTAFIVVLIIDLYILYIK
jgi:hypothetical protein